MTHPTPVSSIGPITAPATNFHPPPVSSIGPITDPATNFITLEAEKPEDKAKDAAGASARAAAAQALPFVWKEKELAPYTPSREAAFHQHRAAINAPPFGDCLADSNAFAADAARLLWYLSHEPAEWLQFLSRQPRGRIVEGDWVENNAHAALEVKIQEWMDQTWTGSDQERVEAYKLGVEIITRSRLLRAVPADPADPDDSGN